MTLSSESLRPLFAEWAQVMQVNKTVLTELDRVVGDGDLGLTMSDGFAAASDYAQHSDETDLRRFFYLAGKAMASAVPSTMDTLMASGLMQAGKVFKGRETMTLQDAGDFFQAWFDGVQQRSRAKKLFLRDGPGAGGTAWPGRPAERGAESVVSGTAGRASDHHDGGKARACVYPR